MAEDLKQVAALCGRFSADRPFTDAVQADLAAARMRVMHALYLTAHATTVGLFERSRHRFETAPLDRKPLLDPVRSPYLRRGVTGWVDHFDRLERTLGAYVNAGTYGRVIAGERPNIDRDVTRVQSALSGWSLAAGRSLTGTPSAADLAYIARVEVAVHSAGLRLIEASRHAGGYDPGDRAIRAVSGVARRWQDVKSRWEDFTSDHADRIDGPLVTAGREVVAAYGEVLRDGAAHADLDQVARHPDLAQHILVTLRSLPGAADLALDMRPHAANQMPGSQRLNPRLRGPTYKLRDRLTAEVEAQIGSGRRPESDRDKTWMSVPPVHAPLRTSRAPRPVAQGLRASIDQLKKASRAAAIITAPIVETGSWSIGEPLAVPPSAGAAAERRRPPSVHASTGGIPR